MLARLDPLLRQPLAFAHRRQAAGLLVLLVVAAFLIEGEEAGKAHDLAASAEVEPARAGFRQNVDGGALELGALHLASNGARPDEFVELGLLGFEMAGDVARAARHVGRPDRFVRFLGVLGLDDIFPGRLGHVVVAEILGDDAPRRRHRLGGEIDAVGAHIGDEAGRAVADVDAFIETLGDLHGARRGEAELARRLLLQGRSGERRIGMAPDGARLDGGDRELGALQRRLERLGLGSRADVETADLLPVGADKPGGEGRVGRRLQVGDDRPVFAGDELFDFKLAVANDAERHRLDTARRAGAGKLSPQHRGKGEADEVVERPARSIGVDQRFVDLARMAHCLLDRVLGDRIEHHPIDPLVLQKLLILEDFMHVPGDRLALPVGVGRQNNPFGQFDRAADFAQPLGGLGVDLPTHGEVVVRIDRTILGRQIAHMPEGGVDAVVLAEILVDGLRLCGRFDDHDFHVQVISFRGAQRKAQRSNSGAGYGEARPPCQISAAAGR